MREEDETRDAAVMERIRELAASVGEMKERDLRYVLGELDGLKRSCFSYKAKVIAEHISSKTCALVSSVLAGVRLVSSPALCTLIFYLTALDLLPRCLVCNGHWSLWRQNRHRCLHDVSRPPIFPYLRFRAGGIPTASPRGGHRGSAHLGECARVVAGQ